MKGWLGDLLRTVWAMFFWNARKSLYRLSRNPGKICPCHNPSDSGLPMQTGCEAVLGWRQAGRFHRVCPLIRQNEAGQWVCSVRAAEVRPFWGRAAAYTCGGFAVLALCGVLGLYGLMHGIGYKVTLRQLAWPPAWHELRTVRSQLFIKQAREAYTAGRVREALNALIIAYEMDPGNYSVGMMLAQFYQAGNPGLADNLYARLLREHPEHRVETARVWFRSLLNRGRLQGVAEVARRQLLAEPQQVSAWMHALIFASRHLQDPAPLDAAARSQDLSEPVRATLRLAARVQRLPAAEARTVLLTTPLAADFVYDRVYRIETLTRLGFAEEAASLLVQSRAQLAGRDLARLAFAIYALRGDAERLDREFTALLSPTRNLQPHELSLLAVHLINWPDPNLLAKLCAAFNRMLAQPLEIQLEVGLNVYCAAGVQKNRECMNSVHKSLSRTASIPLNSLNKLGAFFLAEKGNIPIEVLLPQQQGLSLELNYALMDRYLSNRSIADSVHSGLSR